MNNAITVGGLLSGLLIMAGLLVGAFGLLSFMAGAMSDAPQAGADAGKTGCICMAVGIAAIIAAGFWLF